MAAPSTIALPERYRVERRIASGGMASVWLAHDEVLRRRVAVKVLSVSLGEDESYRARFAREARAAARISDCGHVVTIYDIGEHADRTFIVMELFGGGTVADRIREPGLVPTGTALRWLRETAIALDCAHEHGIVHRDVKPANLLLAEDGRLAVADFGIAHVADETRQLTAVGSVVGTAAYFSPEQALGDTVTSASDRYALAAVAFELLCGERPYLAENATAQARQHIEAPVPRASDRRPDLPAAVDDVLARGLAKDPADRPATAAGFVADLERALHEAPQEQTEEQTQVTQRVPRSARPRAVPPRSARPRADVPRVARSPEPPAPGPRHGRRRVLVPVLVVLVAALAVAGALLALGGGGDDPQRSAASTTRASTPRAATRPTATTAPAAAQAPATSQPAAPTTTQPAAPATSSATTATPSAASPAQLNDQGFALIRRQDYAGAVPLLERSVAGFRAQGATGQLAYAYALYNLAYALARTGRGAEAVPLLQERLRVTNDQRGTVQQELRRVQGKGGDGGKGPKPGKGP